MKKQIATTLGALVIGLSASAYPDALPGEWTQVDRICTDGTLPEDAFKQGRDELKLEIQGANMEIRGKVDGKKFYNEYSLMVSDLLLIMIDDEGTPLPNPYIVSADQLTLFSAGFGDGGSCPIGEGMMATFKKTK